MNNFKKILLLVTLCWWLPIGVCIADEGVYRPRVAVVLSGGGAKGVAHISALKVIEEIGIPVDYVVGTSMGAIIGGLYSVGYSPIQLDSIVKAQDWEWLLSDKPKRIHRTVTEQEKESRYILSIPMTRKVTLQKPESLAKGQNIGDVFAALTVGYHDSISFSQLPISFACVATDITDGSEIILDKGVVAEAMRASMAIPGIFSPIRKNGKILIDGGLVNNYPVDVARRMGADIIIGVDVQEGLQRADHLNSLPEILSQIVDIACQNKYEENRKQTDVYIKVNVKGYSAASFNKAAIDTLINRGLQAAEQCRKQLYTIKERLKETSLSSPRILPNYNRNWHVTSIHFNGIDLKDRAWIIRKCKLHENKQISYNQIEQALAILRSELNYSDVNFRLLEENKGYRLIFHLSEKNVTRFNIGIRFDTEEVASLLLNSSVYLPINIPSTLSVTGRLGNQYMAGIKYTFHISLMRDINLQYKYHYRDIDFYEHGGKDYNLTYNHHSLGINYSSVWLRNFRYKIGATYELYHNPDMLHKNEVFSPQQSMIDNIMHYFVSLDYNTQDRSLFPTYGFKFGISGHIYTDNLVQYRNHSPFYALAGNFTGIFPLNKRLALLPSVNIRVLQGTDIPIIYKNAIGGEVPSRYLSQQIPFMGVSHIEVTNNSLLVGGLKIRFRIVDRHYLSCIGNIAANTDKLYHIGKRKLLYGIGLNYAFDSRFGPLESSVGYSNNTDNFYCFANIGYYF